MSANLGNSAVAAGLEKVSFYSNPKDWQCQRMFRLPYNCTHFMCKQGTWMCAQSCLTRCDHMDCSPPGPPVHGIFWARILGWVAISFSRGSWSSNWTHVSHISCIGKQILCQLCHLGSPETPLCLPTSVLATPFWPSSPPASPSLDPQPPCLCAVVLPWQG